MKTSLRIFILLAAVVTFCNFTATTLEAAESARVQVILVEASNAEGGVDGSLRRYAGTLQRLFRFNSYKQVTSKSMRLNIPGEGSVSLSGGQSLSLKSSGGSRSGVSAELTWSRGSKRLVHTRLQLRPGSPAVLGGPSSGSGSYLLILVLN
ncbi:MAG: hypothetical protein AB3N63_07990 [Puniceicoccaceae bacterium]